LDSGNILLRGCVVRNTDRVVAVVGLLVSVHPSFSLKLAVFISTEISTWLRCLFDINSMSLKCQLFCFLRLCACFVDELDSKQLYLGRSFASSVVHWLWV
jgi:hypothetical protein